MRGGPTAIRSDVLVLGSTLGALVAACAVARRGLRVVLLEEETHAKRPGLLREPFALTGLGTGEPLDLQLRDLNVPLLERREFAREDVALQVALPGARIDVGSNRAALRDQLEAYGLAGRQDVGAWLEELDAAGDEERARLLEAKATTSSGGFSERAGSRRSSPRARSSGPPPPPGELAALVRAQLAACSGLTSPGFSAAAAMLLRTLRDGAYAAPHARRGFLDVFRRRFLASHGEICPVGPFGLSTERGEVHVELPRRRLFARAALIGAPRALICGHIEEQGGAVPRWLRGAPAPLVLETALLRAERRVLPVGMARRLVSVGGSEPGDCWWLSRSSDLAEPQVEWLVLRGPGAAAREWQGSLAQLAPFSDGGIVPTSAGPDPLWDRDACELSFPQAGLPLVLKRRPLIAAVGPEVAPEHGIEGEVLLARRVAEHLLERLGAPRRPA